MTDPAPPSDKTNPTPLSKIEKLPRMRLKQPRENAPVVVTFRPKTGESQRHEQEQEQEHRK